MLPIRYILFSLILITNCIFPVRNLNSGESEVTPHRKHVSLCQQVYIINITSMKVTQKHINLLFSVTDLDI